MTIRSHKPSFKFLNLTDCLLKTNRIDVWQFSLLNEPADFEIILNDEERARAERFHFPIHRKRSIAAHTTVRRILSHYLSIPPNEIEYDYNEHGKPSIKKNSILQFNLSHSEDLALLVVGKDKPVGIDLEFFSARPYEGIGQHIFSIEENEFLMKLPEFIKPLGFFHLWSQKEALIKACGLGLSYPTKQLTLPLMPPVNQIIFDPLHKTNWQIISFMPSVGCCAAVCFQPNVNEIRFHHLLDINHQ